MQELLPLLVMPEQLLKVKFNKNLLIKFLKTE